MRAPNEGRSDARILADLREFRRSIELPRRLKAMLRISRTRTMRTAPSASSSPRTALGPRRSARSWCRTTSTA